MDLDENPVALEYICHGALGLSYALEVGDRALEPLLERDMGLPAEQFPGK